MRRTTIITMLLLISSIAADAQTPKAERIKEIRSVYAQAKKKVDQNGKNGKSRKDMCIILNRLTDEDIPLYDTEQLNYFFDETSKDGGVATKRPYFITENWGNHGHLRYREVLLNPKDQKVMFCYMRGETDGGFVVESRYYYNEQGQCIEEKHNTSNSWTTADSEKENADYYLKIFNLINYDGYFTPLDTDAPKKPTTPQAERLKHIRTVYAQAKEKSAANDKKEMSDDLIITIHDLGDDQPPRTSETKVYFDNDGIYFINNTSKSMQLNGYSEYLFDPKTKDLIFSYSRGAEEGEVYEWRYYFDENGKCIETKTNHPDEVDEGFYDKRAAKDWQVIFKILNEEGDR